MDISLFDYELPQELIAQHPSRKRDQSRLMVIDRKSNEAYKSIESFKNIIDYVKPGDALVVNNTKVFKARLFGNSETGAKVEVFLIRKSDNTDNMSWYAFVSPSRRVKEKESISFDNEQ